VRVFQFDVLAWQFGAIILDWLMALKKQQYGVRNWKKYIASTALCLDLVFFPQSGI